MDELTYQQWWQLHLRAARGETLSPDERVNYEAGLSSLEHDEPLRLATDALQARVRWVDLESEYSALERRRQELDAEIAQLESQLNQHTRQFLGVED